MCMQVSSVRHWHSWNWSGDKIVHTPIITASRTIPGRGNKRYDIDIREFLTTANNAVVGERLSQIVKTLSAEEQACFRSHSRGSFDFRADTIVKFVGTLRYLLAANKGKRGPDYWLFPDETLEQGGGDCEDLAFLLAALLMAAGVSGYCIRVALGTLNITPPRGKTQRHDHSWVMYQNEDGAWEILEPLAAVAAGKGSKKKAAPASECATEYVPHYVFNADHLWLIDSQYADAQRAFDDYCGRRSFWNKFDPSFAASVHNTIFDAALQSLVPDSALSAMKRRSLWLDANIFGYDPRDHFDTGYIDEGWERVNTNLSRFQNDNSDWGSLGAAGHAIADFYAHSSYVHFAKLQNPTASTGQAVVYAPNVGLIASPSYTATPADPSLPPFDLTSGRFSTNTGIWDGTHSEAAGQWSGQILSGRYAQRRDPKATFFEGFTSIPRDLTDAPDYEVRGSLPHHNEIAVDGPALDSKHRLYAKTAADLTDRQSYNNQFRWRKNSAIAHVRKAFQENWRG